MPRETVLIRVGSAILQIQYDEADESAIDDEKFRRLVDAAYKRFIEVARPAGLNGAGIQPT